MPDAANPQIIDTISTDNLKTIAEAGAFQMGLSFGNSTHWQNLTNQNAVALQQMGIAQALQQQQRQNEISNAVQQVFANLLATTAGTVAKQLSELDPSQAMAEQALLTGNKVAEQLSNLGAALAGMQAEVKAAQTVPPVSAPAPVSGA